MNILWLNVAIFNLLLPVNLALSASLDVQPSPVATVTEGAVLWLTCTYDLDGGTLGQLQWTGNDGSNVASATPTSTPQCSSVSPDSYSVDCNLASNEVRLGILNPIHGDTYSCSVYLSDFTLIGPVSTQVSVVVPVTSVTFTSPVSDTVTVAPGGSQVYTCVTGSCRPPARIDWYKDGLNITTHSGIVNSDGNKFVTTSSLTMIGGIGDSPATVQCWASNVEGRIPVQSGVKTFVVQYGPESTLAITPPDIAYTRTEGDTLPNITCTADCRPGCTFVWTRPDKTNFTVSPVMSLGQLDKSEHGTYKCIARNSLGESVLTVDVNIIEQ